MNELELRYGDCTVKKLSGGTLNAALRNLEKFHYAGTRLGTIRITEEFGCPVAEIHKDPDAGCWHLTPEGSSKFPGRQSAAELMRDIRSLTTAPACD